MTSVVFVHGTGVREPVASQAYETIRSALSAMASPPSVRRCYWGDAFGTRLFAGGLSVPDYATARGPEDEGERGGASISDGPYLAELWNFLGQDPLFELRLQETALTGGRGGTPEDDQPPNAASPAQAVLRRARQLQSTLTTTLTGDESAVLGSLAASLKKTGLDEAFPDAFTGVIESEICRSFFRNSPDPEEARYVVSRAALASALLRSEVRPESGLLFDVDAKYREALVRQIVDAMGGAGRGPIGDLLKRQFLGLIKIAGTGYVRRKRGLVTDKVFGFPGDIILYQARGGAVRDDIRRVIAECRPPVVLLGHSLGGIACVDALVEQQDPRVRLLITVGCQAPLLYEMNALATLPFDKDANPEDRLPKEFPPWANFYDTRDFLSYVGEGLFGKRVTDIRVNNGQYFPEAHSAYWDNRTFWDGVEDLLQWPTSTADVRPERS